MLTLLLFPILLLIVVSALLRALMRPLWNPCRIRRPYFGPYGVYGYGRGYRHQHFPGRGFLTILVLVAVERLFSRRW